MARPSNKDTILQAAIAVAERDGLAAVSIDSVAQQAGLTKGGLLYHFPNRHALLTGVYAYMAKQWDAEMEHALGTDPATATSLEKLRAYIRVSGKPITRAELVFLADAGANPEYSAPWSEVTNRWVPAIPRTPTPSQDALLALVAQFAADGLWGHSAFSDDPIPAHLRSLLINQIIQLLDSHIDSDK